MADEKKKEYGELEDCDLDKVAGGSGNGSGCENKIGFEIHHKDFEEDSPFNHRPVTPFDEKRPSDN